MDDTTNFSTNEALNMDDLRQDYLEGQMCDDEAYDLGIIDEFGYYEYPDNIISKT